MCVRQSTNQQSSTHQLTFCKMVNVTRKQKTKKMSSQKLSKMPKWLYKGRISLLPKVNMFGKLVCLKSDSIKYMKCTKFNKYAKSIILNIEIQCSYAKSTAYKSKSTKSTSRQVMVKSEIHRQDKQWQCNESDNVWLVMSVINSCVGMCMGDFNF